MPLAPNQQFHEYRIVRTLGQGGFGTVYLAQDTLLDRPVAIKELTVTKQTDEQAFKRFMQEARTAGGLNHPNVVTIYALKVEGPNVYLVMEYIGGGSLRSLLEKQGKLDIEQAVKIAIDVCEGLAAVHAKGIVHRDIKPENILLTEDGRAKVSDFGIAHVPRGSGGTSLTQAGFQPGTLVYMSPEQVLGKPVDARSDVYQVGELLYEMLAGKHYIDLAEIERQARDSTGGNSLRMQAKVFDLLADAICVKPLTPLRPRRPDAPDELRGIIKIALAKNPAQRTASASDLSRKLTAWLDQYASVIQTAFIPADPEEAERHPELGENLLKQGQIEDAIREYQIALSLNPNSAKLHVEVGAQFSFLSSLVGVAGNREMKAQLLEAAIREYKTAVQIAPNDAEAHAKLAEAYSSQGRLNDAVYEFQTALRFSPQNGEMHTGLGKIYEEQGRINEAVREYKIALSINPNDADAHNKLGDFYMQHKDDIDSAIQEYQLAIRLTPKERNVCAVYHAGLGLAYQEQGRLEDAIKEFQTAIEIAPFLTMPHANLVAIYDDLGRFDDAMREGREALRTNPDSFETHYNLAGVYKRAGRLEDAVHEYDEVVRLNPGIADAYGQRAKLHERLGEYSKAIADYSQFIQFYPDAGWGYGARAGLYRLLEQEQAAKRDFEQAIAWCSSQIDNDSSNARAYNGRAWYLAQVGRIEEALQDANRAIELDHRNGNCFGTRGTIHVLLGDFDRALQDLDQCLKLSPEDAVSYHLRGRVRSLRGDKVGAARDLARAKELDPYIEREADALVLEKFVEKIGKGSK